MGGGVVLDAEGVAGRGPALLHGGRGQGGESHHVADRVYVGLFSLVVIVDGYAASVVGGQAGGVEIQDTCCAHPPNGIHEEVGCDSLSRLERCDGLAADGLHELNLFAEPEDATHVAHVVDEGLGQLPVNEIKDAGPFLHHGNIRAEGGEDRGVLDSDYTRADHCHGAGYGVQAEHSIGVDDRLAVNVESRQGRGRRAGGYHDLVGLDSDHAFSPGYRQYIGRFEGGFALQNIDAVAPHLVADNLGFLDDHVVATEQKVIPHGDVFFDREGRAVDSPLSEAGQV